MNKLLSLMLVLNIITIASCVDNRLSKTFDLSINRSEFVSMNEISQQKEIFETLSFENQRNLWLSKLEQIHRSGIGNKQQKIISEITKILIESESVDMFLDDARVKKYVVKLAEITPKDDFIMMFETLDDYSFSSSRFSMHQPDPIFVMQVFQEINSTERQSILIKKSDLPSCNCGWTCGDSFSQCTHSNCEQTRYGCGFLWLQSCKKRDELLAADCP
jgi:hypothetical protein